MKDVFISSKILFSFSRYSNFCIFIFPSFSSCQPFFRPWSKIKLKVYDVINCLSKNLITHFVRYLDKKKRYDFEILSIDRVLNNEHFLWKNHAENVRQKLVPDPFFYFGKQPRTTMACKKFFLKIRYC